MVTTGTTMAAAAGATGAAATGATLAATTAALSGTAANLGGYATAQIVAGWLGGSMAGPGLATGIAAVGGPLVAGALVTVAVGGLLFTGTKLLCGALLKPTATATVMAGVKSAVAKAAGGLLALLLFW